MPISAISFGTQYGSVEINGTTQRVEVDDRAVQKIADLSGGDFYDAQSAGELSEVYDSLSEQIGYETRRGDASKPWLIAGTIAGLLAATGAIAIGQRLP